MELILRTVIAVCLLAGTQASAQSTPSDATAVEATVRGFHQALASGDAAGALRLLATDAVILEGGARETRDEYAAHHLPEDIEFARAVPMQRGPIQVTVSGNTAWASSTGKLQGTFRSRPIDMAVAELMVLSRAAAAWEIRAIHWSSR
jgi:ketosteroid isomerase-like protein